MDFNIISVPSGHYYREAEEIMGAGRPLTIEYLPAEEANDVSEHSSEKFDSAQKIAKSKHANVVTAAVKWRGQ